MKRTTLFILLILFALGLSAQEYSCALSPNELWAVSLQHRLDSITKRVETQRYKAGYCIYDLTADSVLYQYNSHNMMKPASTQKLFVSITALSTIGGDYDFCTYANIDGTVKTDCNGRRYLKGDICINGSFDPTLQQEAIEYFGDKMDMLRIDSIDGIIVVDNQVKLDLKKIKDVQQYFGNSLYRYLQNKGYSFSNPEPYTTSATPLTRGWNLAKISTPITKVLNPMLKRSNNTYAECMLLNLYDFGKLSGWSYDRCRQQVREMIVNANGSTDDYTIIDGSGLSHDNRSTPELLTNILRYAYHNEDVYPLLYENLPIAGVDGTLDTRMKKEPIYKNVRAKTGTLNGVSTLSGYVTAANGHLLCFAIMVNNLSSSSIGKTLQDNICFELAR